MILNTKNVKKVFMDCLFNDEEINKDINLPLDLTKLIKVEGITSNFGFNLDKLNKNKKNIIDLLKQLPDTFYKNKGGGWTFLNLCLNNKNEIWTGFHLVMEQLMVLGIGIGKVKYLLNKELWISLPERMPYIVIDLEN